MADAIKKETEHDVKTGFCDSCNCHRFFYRHKSGGPWFCQVCNWRNERIERIVASIDSSNPEE
jgi:hypothetical protein